ncbi:MAG: ral secretion pathway protein [Gammaproteobacteria bacterium]|nr:ral secretion pathway protein [Gammaproteobacteria bacterium]
MPTSRSPQPSAKAAATATRPRFVRWFILIVALEVLMVVVIALPASMMKRFLPASVEADDFSGSLWHGSAGKITAGARNIGALEWRLHPWSLLDLTLSADLHWVKTGFVADATADATRRGLTMHHVQGGGPIEDLGDFGIAVGWRGNTSFKFGDLKVAFANGAATLASIVGDVTVSNLASPQIADGANLGAYALHVADSPVAPDTGVTAVLNDTTGPLEVEATIRLSPDGHTGMLSGTVKERADAPPPLRSQLNELAQMRARDPQGRIPVELEFTL